MVWTNRRTLRNAAKAFRETLRNAAKAFRVTASRTLSWAAAVAIIAVPRLAVAQQSSLGAEARSAKAAPVFAKDVATSPVFTRDVAPMLQEKC